MKNSDDFYKELLILKKNPLPGYGGNVIPAMEVYSKISSTEEKRAYQDAIEALLQSDVKDVRNFGVSLCLGFFVFRDVISNKR